MFMSSLSCFSVTAFVLLAAGLWMYFNMRGKPEAERRQALTISLTVSGILACLAATAIAVYFIWGLAHVTY